MSALTTAFCWEAMIVAEPKTATQHPGGSTMKTTIKCIAPWLAAAAVSAAIGFAPIASAAPAATPSSQDTVVTHPTLSPTPTPTPTPFDTGSDPLVEGNIGADPAVPYFPGEGRAF